MVRDQIDHARVSDAELLSAIADCDGAAFATFYRRHLSPVLAYLVRQTGDPETAADLAAEVFAAVLLASGRYRAVGASAGPWVLGIAHNKLLMSLRRGRVETKARRKLRFEAIEFEDEDYERVEATVAEGTGRLARLVARLPADERFAAHARVIEERSYPGIAEGLGCSELASRHLGKR